MIIKVLIPVSNYVLILELSTRKLSSKLNRVKISRLLCPVDLCLRCEQGGKLQSLKIYNLDRLLCYLTEHCLR